MSNQTLSIQEAANRKARLSEIAQLIEEQGVIVSEKRVPVDRLKASIAFVQKDLDREKAPALRGEIRTGRMRRDEIEQAEAHVAQLQEQLDFVQADYDAAVEQLEALNSERQELESYQAEVTAEDLRQARAELSSIEAKVARIEQAKEDAASKNHSEHAEAIQSEIDTLKADHDLMAADVDMGQGSGTELKKLTTKITKLEKQLSDALETQSLSESTQRGYQRRLDALATERSEAERGYRSLVSLYAGGIHRAGVKRLTSSMDEIRKGLTDILIAGRLSEQEGDGTVFSHSTGRARLDAPGVLELENDHLEADLESAEKQIERILADIQKG